MNVRNRRCAKGTTLSSYAQSDHMIDRLGAVQRGLLLRRRCRLAMTEKEILVIREVSPINDDRRAAPGEEQVPVHDTDEESAADEIAQSRRDHTFPDVVTDCQAWCTVEDAGRDEEHIGDDLWITLAP